MASELKIPSGTRLHMAYDVPLGKEPDYNMVCTFNKAIDESAFLVSVPMVGGKSLLMDENQKMLIRVNQGGEELVIAAYADDVVKEGIRRYWKMRRVSEQRQFIKRRDERLKIALKVDYFQPTWPIGDDGRIGTEESMTLDVSAGGAALFVNRHFEIGEVIVLTLPRIGIAPEGAAIPEVVAAVCWDREAPKGSSYRFVCGVQFRMGDDAQREQLQDYMLYVKKTFKL